MNYGVYIVTSRSGESINGQTATSPFQVTSDPLQIAVVINKNNLTHQYISEGKVFGVCILAKETPLDFIFKFGFFSGRKINKFENLEHGTGITGVPLLNKNTVAVLEAVVVSQADVGTHTIFVGKLVDAKVISGDEPLTYAYYRIKKAGLTPTTAPTYLKG